MDCATRIVECDIHEGMYQNSIWVRYENIDGWDCICRYYPDELSYTKDEFIGKTRLEARELIHRKDVEYLRS